MGRRVRASKRGSGRERVGERERNRERERERRERERERQKERERMFLSDMFVTFDIFLDYKCN